MPAALLEFASMLCTDSVMGGNLRRSLTNRTERHHLLLSFRLAQNEQRINVYKQQPFKTTSHKTTHHTHFNLHLHHTYVEIIQQPKAVTNCVVDHFFFLFLSLFSLSVLTLFFLSLSLWSSSSSLSILIESVNAVGFLNLTLLSFFSHDYDDEHDRQQWILFIQQHMSIKREQRLLFAVYSIYIS